MDFVHGDHMYTRSDIARELHCDPKKLRGFIRSDDHLKRPPIEHGQPYSYTFAEREEAKRLYRAHFG